LGFYYLTRDFGLGRSWNYIFAIFLVPVGVILALKVRHIQTSAWLSIVMALSLMVAPYSFAYDLPLLIPV